MNRINCSFDLQKYVIELLFVGYEKGLISFSLPTCVWTFMFICPILQDANCKKKRKYNSFSNRKTERYYDIKIKIKLQEVRIVTMKYWYSLDFFVSLKQILFNQEIFFPPFVNHTSALITQFWSEFLFSISNHFWCLPKSFADTKKIVCMQKILQ